MLFNFDNEIMSKHFGYYRSLSIKGCSARFFPNPNDVKAGETITTTHLSDVLKQNSATTHAHMLVLASFLMKKQRIITGGGTILQNMDDCAK